MKYDIIYADPPWWYPRTSTFNRTGASSYYNLLPDDEMLAFDIKRFCNPRAAVFVWATCPRLDFALDCLKSWGLHYRGVAFVWVKTRRSDGAISGAKGPPPSFVKPNIELVLAASTVKTGRPFPLERLDIRQVITAPRLRHSEKPVEVRDSIIALLGDRPRVELFARQKVDGWDSWGDGVSSDISLGTA